MLEGKCVECRVSPTRLEGSATLLEEGGELAGLIEYGNHHVVLG